MVGWLIRKFVPDWQDTNKSSVRTGVGKVCGWVGIFLNTFLFLSKYLVGLLVHSISIRADAINNLTDAASNVVSILSFHFAEKPADEEHPFGHERTESITSLFVGMAIAFLGFETLKESVEKIFHPTPDDFRWVTVFVLCLSIAVKLVMYLYNNKYGKKYHSSLLTAAALDSRSDCIGTFAVLVSTCLSPILHFSLDGYMGVIVSFIIFYSAYDLLKEVINSLMGEAPDPGLVQQLTGKILASEYVIGLHDLMIHNYGPGINYATCHTEVDGKSDIMMIHDHIDKIEKQVKEEMGIDLTIHMDPILMDDPLTKNYLLKFENAAKALGKGKWGIHDFRVQPHDEAIDVSFDLVVPYEEVRSQEELARLLLNFVRTKRQLNLDLTLEHPNVI